MFSKIKKWFTPESSPTRPTRKSALFADEPMYAMCGEPVKAICEDLANNPKDWKLSCTCSERWPVGGSHTRIYVGALTHKKSGKVFEFSYTPSTPRGSFTLAVFHLSFHLNHWEQCMLVAAVEWKMSKPLQRLGAIRQAKADRYNQARERREQHARNKLKQELGL